MNHAPKYLLFALGLTLASCKSLPAEPPSYVPPKVDCEAFAPPRVEAPSEPSLTDKALLVWQLYAFALQEYARDLLGQRYETALCMKDLQDKQVIR